MAFPPSPRKDSIMSKEETHEMTNAAVKQKNSPKVLKETAEQTIERLNQENADLKAIAASQPTINQSDAKYMQDIDFLQSKKTGAGGNRIEVKEITDHKNIPLWTPWGKRIGPMHPNNATYVYHKFRRLGRILHVRKPSEEDIRAYYKSPEYIAWKKKHDANREQKSKSKSGAGLDKVIDAMVNITGQNRRDIISIIDKPMASV